MNKKTYIYQYEDWPNFIWDINEISDLLAEVRNKQRAAYRKNDRQKRY